MIKHEDQTEAFMWTEPIMCLNRGRSKGEDCGHIKSI